MSKETIMSRMEYLFALEWLSKWARALPRRAYYVRHFPHSWECRLEWGNMEFICADGDSETRAILNAKQEAEKRKWI